MTLEQAQSLTDDEIRVRVAELCGWTEISTRCMWGLPPGADDDGTEECLKHFANYPADLNACHEFEATINQANIAKYNHRLQSVCLDAPVSDPASDYAWHCTARQRCEAFVTVMGKDTP